ncbi:permease [Methanococcus sp. CF]
MIQTDAIFISIEHSFNFFANAFPYILFGFLISAYMKVKLKGNLRQKFVHILDNSKKSIVVASLIGAVLPLCSASGVPVANVMNSKGTNLGITMSFIVSASSITPLGVMLTYSLLGWEIALMQILASMILACFIGILFYNYKIPFYFEENNIKPDDTYLKVLFKQMANLMPAIMIGFLISGFMMSFIPKDIILYALSNNLMMYFYASVARIFIFLCPNAMIPLISSVAVNGVPRGLILSFLISAPSIGLPMILAMLKVYGKKIALIYVFGIIILSGLIGIVIDIIL